MPRPGLSPVLLVPLSATAGTGRTGFVPVGPNNYPFYSTDEIYKPVLQNDGGQLSGMNGSFACSHAGMY
jgi:hypothetical protein